MGRSMYVFSFRRTSWCGLAIVAAFTLTACGTWVRYEDIQLGKLTGHVYVVWHRQDKFIYRRKSDDPLLFQPTFMKTPIDPHDMYTDGGSVPQVLWGIPGLSPWALGPAYIIHDWIFEVHRCPNRKATSEEKAITFEQSAIILAQVGKALVEAGLVDDNKLELIVWAVRTRYARNLWDAPGTSDDCKEPTTFARVAGVPVVNFKIPAPRRR